MTEGVLVKVERDPLFGMTREEYIARLRSLLAGRVDEAYFFGSFTGDRFSRSSDIDIILVKETTAPFFQRALEFGDLLDLVPSTDILVYTRRELDSLVEENSVGFWKSVKEGMVRFL